MAFRYGELQIVGLERYQSEVVLNSVPFHPGDPYRRDQLLAFQAALQNGQLFNSAAVTIKPDPALHAAVPVAVNLVEAQSKHFGAGVGYSSITVRAVKSIIVIIIFWGAPGIWAACCGWNKTPDVFHANRYFAGCQSLSIFLRCAG